MHTTVHFVPEILFESVVYVQPWT